MMMDNSVRITRFVSSALVTAILVALCFCAGTAAADAAGLAGKWKMASATPDGATLVWTLTMKQEGGVWIATVGANDGDVPAKEVRVDGVSVHMKTPYNGDYYDIDLKLAGDSLTGKWSGNGDSGVTTGTRIAESAVK